MLYLHGLGGGGKWESFNMAMATVTRTVAPNLPGWQHGEPPDGITAPKDYAALMVKFLDHVGLERVTASATPSAGGSPSTSRSNSPSGSPSSC